MEVRLFISVASCREWKPAFGASMLNLNCYLLQKGIKDRKLTQVYPDIAAQASCLSGSRELAFTKALKGNFTHWLSLDDDMMFPHDVVERMIVHEKDVVTANYRRKIPDKVLGVCMGLDGKILDSTDKSGIEKIGWMGGGCFLADMEKIKYLPYPHFECVWCPEKQDYYDQDNYFSSRLREHGKEIWVDHSLSQEVIHVGDYHFKFPQEAQEFLAAAE